MPVAFFEWFEILMVAHVGLDTHCQAKICYIGYIILEQKTWRLLLPLQSSPLLFSHSNAAADSRISMAVAASAKNYVLFRINVADNEGANCKELLPRTVYVKSRQCCRGQPCATVANLAALSTTCTPALETVLEATEGVASLRRCHNLLLYLQWQ